MKVFNWHQLHLSQIIKSWQKDIAGNCYGNSSFIGKIWSHLSPTQHMYRCPGFSQYSISFPSVAVPVLCFGFRMRLVLITLIFWVLLGHVNPKSRTSFFSVSNKARKEHSWDRQPKLIEGIFISIHVHIHGTSYPPYKLRELPRGCPFWIWE